MKYAQQYLSEFAPELSQKHSGAYFTPDAVARSLVAWAVHKSDDRMLDPSCGDGQFLVLHRNSVGLEQNPHSASIAMSRAPWALVHEGDFFCWAAETQERFECAAGNPPFIRYQSFRGQMRERAFDLCRRLGVEFSGLASAWAPFLVATCGLLKEGGRMAFVVPAEIGHASYAAPLIEYLLGNFGDVHVVAVREKLFPRLSEDCWLLYASEKGKSAPALKFTSLDRFLFEPFPPAVSAYISISEWRDGWGKRLRPFLISPAARQLYLDAATSSESRRLQDFARIGIGYVSGANDFFHLRPSEAKAARITDEYLVPSLRNGRAITGPVVSNATVQRWFDDDEEVLLLRLEKGGALGPAVKRYLDSAEGRRAREAYKCRNREPWYSVPDVRVPDYFMSYMSGLAPSLARNDAQVTCTNSVHSISVLNKSEAKMRLPLWSTSFVNLSFELEGHALGGGMLKLEPREAARILFPENGIAKRSSPVVIEAVAELRRWRHIH